MVALVSFDECVDFSLRSLDICFDLKEKQGEFLREKYNKDFVGILPTGYGNRLVFQLLPYLQQRKFGSQRPMLVLGMCPLNSLMEDQCATLRENGLHV